MHPRYYLETDVFTREQNKIFRKLWLFAGLKNLLTKNNSFITKKITNIPVVIQNFNGQLRAFENVCLHRSSLIQTDSIGCRPLVCPYHAWKYDSTGSVSNIPQCSKIYQFSDGQQKTLKLKEFHLRSIGNLLFINLDPDPLPLEKQFSADLIKSLESSSMHYDFEVMVTTWSCNFNWKLAYENLRDFNHIAYVHPKTLAKSVVFHPVVNESLFRTTETPWSSSHPESLIDAITSLSTGGKDADIHNMRRFGWHDMIHRCGEEDAYYNWLVYPNLHIASPNGGHSFTIEYHHPISPSKTDIEIYRFTAKKKNNFESSSAVLLAEMHESKLVVGEDVRILESVQAALHLDAPMPMQGAYEGENRLVERWYTALMETEHEL